MSRSNFCWLSDGISQLSRLTGWQKLHNNYGKLPWSDLFQPAINLARNGFLVTVDLADAIAQENVTVTDPLFAEVYAPNGTKLVAGDTGRL